VHFVGIAFIESLYCASFSAAQNGAGLSLLTNCPHTTVRYGSITTQIFPHLGILRICTHNFINPTTMPGNTPSVLLLSLEPPPWPCDLYEELYAALRTKADVFEATTSKTALEYLSSPSHLTAVLVTEVSVMKLKHRAVSTKLVEYTRQGGTVILGCLCSSFSRPSDINRFFQDTWGLSWRSGSYHRTTFQLNPMANARFREDRYPSLSKSYSMKALHLKDVPVEAQVYVSNANSTIESLVFAPVPVDNRHESPMILAQFGDGYLGWVGDVNAEKDSTHVVVAMCNL